MKSRCSLLCTATPYYFGICCAQIAICPVTFPEREIIVPKKQEAGENLLNTNSFPSAFGITFVIPKKVLSRNESGNC